MYVAAVSCYYCNFFRSHFSHRNRTFCCSTLELDPGQKLNQMVKNRSGKKKSAKRIEESAKKIDFEHEHGTCMPANSDTMTLSHNHFKCMRTKHLWLAIRATEKSKKMSANRNSLFKWQCEHCKCKMHSTWVRNIGAAFFFCSKCFVLHFCSLKDKGKYVQIKIYTLKER